MKNPTVIGIGILITLSGVMVGSVASGDPGRHERGQGYMQGYPGHHGGGGHGQHHKHHGKGGKGLLGPYWKHTLTQEQVVQIDQLRVAHAKNKAPLKAAAKAIKTELAVLATADEPDTALIDNKIDQLLALKKQTMSQRYAHIAEVRRVLTPEQRPSYDMQILKAKKHKYKRKHKRKRGY